MCKHSTQTVVNLSANSKKACTAIYMYSFAEMDGCRCNATQ